MVVSLFFSFFITGKSLFHVIGKFSFFFFPLPFNVMDNIKNYLSNGRLTNLNLSHKIEDQSF